MEYLTSAYTIFIHIPDMIKHIPDVVSYFYEDPYLVFIISDLSLGIFFTFIQLFIWDGLDYYEIRSYFDTVFNVLKTQLTFANFFSIIPSTFHIVKLNRNIV